MEKFKNKILENEMKYENLTYICKNGNNPILLSAPHTMMQLKEDGNYKMSETFTKAITMYVGDNTDSFYLIKNKDTGIDSNNSEEDTFKNMLLDIIKDNNIKLLIDIHGAKEERDFDIEIGNLNNLSSDFSTVNELVDAFNEEGIFNIEVNEPFKGGMITKTVFFETNIDVIQIEINKKYRNLEKIENINMVCEALINFINQYIRITKEESK